MKLLLTDKRRFNYIVLILLGLLVLTNLAQLLIDTKIVNF